MAFSVSYTPKEYDSEMWHKSVEGDDSPYFDWKARGCPDAATFMHSESVFGETHHIIFEPCSSLSYVKMFTAPFTASITTRLSINEQTKTITIIEATCECQEGSLDDLSQHDCAVLQQSMARITNRDVSPPRVKNIDGYIFGCATGLLFGWDWRIALAYTLGQVNSVTPGKLKMA